MDNRGMPAPSNSQICISKERKNKEAENGVDENNRAILIVISSGSEDDSGDGAAYEEAERRRKGKMVVSASNAERKWKGRAAAPEIPSGNEIPKGKRKIRARKPKLAESDVIRGKFINSFSDTELMGFMPHQRVSSRGRQLKPTSKLLELSNMIDALAGTGSKRKQPKKHLSSNVISRVRSMPRIPVGVVDGPEDATLPLAGVSEGSGAVVSQAGQANGVARQADVVNPGGSGAGSEVGGPDPDDDYWIPDLIVVPFFDPTSAAGQASEANAVGSQTDMVVPLLLQPMGRMTNRNPMGFTVEEAKKYMRTGRVQPRKSADNFFNHSLV